MTNNFTPAKAGQQRNRLSKEEYADKMKAEKEAVYQMADETAKAIVSDPEKFKAFLDTQSRLDRYERRLYVRRSYEIQGQELLGKAQNSIL